VAVKRKVLDLSTRKVTPDYRGRGGFKSIGGDLDYQGTTRGRITQHSTIDLGRGIDAGSSARGRGKVRRSTDKNKKKEVGILGLGGSGSDCHPCCLQKEMHSGGGNTLNSQGDNCCENPESPVAGKVKRRG